MTHGTKNTSLHKPAFQTHIAIHTIWQNSRRLFIWHFVYRQFTL